MNTPSSMAQCVRVTGLHDVAVFFEVRRWIESRYVTTSVQYQGRVGEASFVVPDLRWQVEDQVFFDGLSASGVIEGYSLASVDTTIPECNHTSVGIITLDDQGRFLLLQRKKFPYGIACPAGHVEPGESYEDAAVRELREETGYQATDLSLLLKIGIANQCRRPGGSWHLWQVYLAQITGELIPNHEESSAIGWFTWSEVLEWKLRTEAYLRGYVSEQDWQAWPGLEPVWYDFFHQFGWW